MNLEILKELGSIHKKIRYQVENWIDNNVETILLLDLAEYIEKQIYDNTDNIRSKNRNIAFPVGLNTNNIVAHYTPNNNSCDRFKKNTDMLKIDYGIHQDGNIIDSAFTYCNNTDLSVIREASREAVKNVIKESGVDKRLIELSYTAKEIIESYEYKGNPLSIVDKVASHNIEKYKIHGNKLIYGNPELQLSECTDVKMCENECYAIEFYATNGINNILIDESNISHYMAADIDQLSNCKYSKNTNQLIKCINDNFYKLPFCKRNIYHYNPNIKINRAIKELYSNKQLICYPPIIDKSENTYVSQFEDTIFVTDFNVINLSNNIE